MNKNEIKVLVCDDSLVSRDKLKNILTELNYNLIYEATNGVEAINVCKDINPNIVFLDITMPKISGIEALKSIKDYNKNIKVVIVSSSLTHLNIKNAINFGADEFIQKPFLLEQIKRILGLFGSGGE